MNRSVTPYKVKTDSLKKNFFTLFKEGHEDSVNVVQSFNAQALPKLPKNIRTEKIKNKNIKISSQESKKKYFDTITKLYSPDLLKSTYINRKDRKPSPELAELQKYVIEFQQKSKFLLSQLEAKVLGKDGSNG